MEGRVRGPYIVGKSDEAAEHAKTTRERAVYVYLPWPGYWCAEGYERGALRCLYSGRPTPHEVIRLAIDHLEGR
jgi:hypothetical protein